MADTVSRRQVLTMAATSAAGVLANQQHAAAVGDRSFPIIDTHQHLWDFRKFRPPWLAGEPKLNHSTTMADYYKATRGLNVVKTVYMEVDVAPHQQMEEAQWVEQTCKSHNTRMAAGVVSCRPGEPGFKAYVRGFQGSKYIKGFRQVLQVPGAPRGLCLTPRYIENMLLLGELGFSYDICIRPEELADAAQLADLCPDTRFILDHCGNASARNPHQKQWEADITELGKRKNVVCKISGVIKTVKPEWNAGKELDHIVHHCIHSFGTNRVMFGGDWPVCNNTSSFKGWVDTLQWIVRDMPDADKRKLFHDNAKAYYQLS